MQADVGARMISDIPQTRWARTVDGAAIAYQDFGEGPTAIVVVHGYISHLEVYWELPEFSRLMRRLSRHLRVLQFDKRGVGMSDRVSDSPNLETQLDDVRAVMDAAGVQRAAILAWGGEAGPALGAFFAATHPERVVALWLDGGIHAAKDDDYPWALSEEEWEAEASSYWTTWGSDDHAVAFAEACCGENPEPRVYEDSFLRWLTKLARCSATPNSIEAFERTWRGIDVRPILSSICVPTDVAVTFQDDEDEQRYIASRIPGARIVELPRRSLLYLGDLESYVSAVEHLVESAGREEAALDRMLSTVLFSDIVGSTDKACEVGDACWKELLEKHNATVRAFLARFRGNEVNTTGDGFLATFDGPARAVKCAQALCEAVRPLGLEVRAGCHTGEIELLGADVGGVAVHIGARVAALAGPSEVLVSSTVKDLVAGSGLVFADRGEHTLKGVPDKWRLYAVASAV